MHIYMWNKGQLPTAAPDGDAARLRCTRHGISNSDVRRDARWNVVSDGDSANADDGPEQQTLIINYGRLYIITMFYFPVCEHLLTF